MNLLWSVVHGLSTIIRTKSDRNKLCGIIADSHINLTLQNIYFFFRVKQL